MDRGTEIRLYDPRRDPRNWIDLMRPSDCAVFLKNRATSTACGPDGQPYATPNDVTCIVFPKLENARLFCEAKVQELPHVRCEIYDAEGLAHPPLLVILHKDFQNQDDAGSVWSRRRKLIAGLLILAAVPLLWRGVRDSSSSDVLIFLAINCVVAALRFLYWDFGMKQKEKGRRQRIETHRRVERGDA